MKTVEARLRGTNSEFRIQDQSSKLKNCLKQWNPFLLLFNFVLEFIRKIYKYKGQISNGLKLAYADDVDLLEAAKRRYT